MLQDRAARVLDILWACHFSGQLQRQMLQAARTLLMRLADLIGRRTSMAYGAMLVPGNEDDGHPGTPHLVLDLGDRGVVYKPPSFWQVDDGKDEPADDALRLSQFTQAMHPVRQWPLLDDTRHSRGFLHRLDIPTSGLVLVARTHRAFYDLRLQLALGQLQREYCVLAHGRWASRQELRCRVHWYGSGRQAGSVVAPGGRVALSRLKLLALGRRGAEALSLLAIQIVTGRQHQIRLQMAHVGHPMVTDKRYFSSINCLKDMLWCRRNFLHRYRLAFLGASQTQVEVLEPLPLDLQAALAHVLPGDAGDASLKALQFWQSGSPPQCWEQLPGLEKRWC